MKVAHGITIHCQDDENNLRIIKPFINKISLYILRLLQIWSKITVKNGWV